MARFGFEYLGRDPASFTPTKLDGPYLGKSLILGEDKEANRRSIAQVDLGYIRSPAPSDPGCAHTRAVVRVP